ncbi:MAG TPA: hypothetical protein VMF08_18715 [Candidatus Sulfotelmatobacter sp.]|nr:hypothetical protein [Candidatus Sulfotelmatobacter sp.]
MSNRFARQLSLLLITIFSAVATAARAADPTFKVQDQRLIMENGFVHLEFNERHPSIDVLKGDFSGQGHYGCNLLATNPETGADIVLETIDSNGQIHRSSDAGSSISYKVFQTALPGLTVRIQDIRDRKSHPNVTSTWTLMLLPNSRHFTLTAQTTVTHSRPLKAIQIGVFANQWFMNGFFDRGVEQYVNCGDRTFFTTNSLRDFYTMDNRHGSISVVADPAASPNAWAMCSLGTDDGVGLQAILAGNYPAPEAWQRPDWKSAPALEPSLRAKFLTSLAIYPNDYAFPGFAVARDNPMPLRDLRTFYTAIYGSAAGVLGSFEHPGSAYPTLATPKRPYGDLYTFFDPDSWSTVNTLSYSGNSYLQEQARQILELAEDHLNHGQVPHHFIDGTPTYIAISRATQTGPNIFWVLAAIDYADATGDESWLRANYPQLKAATDWVLDNYDPNRKLVKVGGPLFIDVFIRRGYTLDSNAMLLRLLPEMSAVAEFCGNSADADRYTRLAAAIKEGLNEALWDGHDHYVTQRNGDWSVRDMVDYDGNYAAVAFGAADEKQAAAIFQRLDSGTHTHPGNRGTWTSEKYYGPADCFGGNTGDSATAMARIWWLDLAARYATGDVTNFFKYFRPVQDDLLEHTWLTERYDAHGNLIRAPYYHEYPEITAMVLREMVYGIDIKINRIQIKPFGVRSYHYEIGDLDVSYSPDLVSLYIPGHNRRAYRICGLVRDAQYSLSAFSLPSSDKIVTGHDGTALFQAPAGRRVTLKYVPSRNKN